MAVAVILRADARAIPLRDGCVDCVVTSPPYWGLRDYGHTGQLGLEPTPDLYVAALVGVFREVARVLKPGGTVWLNLGDSYARGTIGRHDAGRNFTGGGGNRLGSGNPGPQGIRSRPDDLKPKDLVGIPWRVAFALQQPWYGGSILNREDRIWLAAMLDAEGCMFIHKRKAGQHNGQGYYRQNDSYGPGVEISNTSLAVVERIMALVGKGSICSQGPNENARRKQTLYRWNLRTLESRDFVRELYPHLIAKQQQARIMCGCPSSGERAEAAHAALIGLHNGFATSVDFKAPESLFVPGWYLRSDIIWNKCNPMPESVTDRPTKAHEYVFLLTKAERYFYDAAAIAEEYAEASLERQKYSFAGSVRPEWEGQILGRDKNPHGGLFPAKGAQRLNPNGRNKRSVWTIPTMPYAGAHFATMPEALVEPCILAGCPLGGLVLDPFLGSGTVGAVAERLGRRWVGTDLSYQPLSKARTAQRGIRFELEEGLP